MSVRSVGLPAAVAGHSGGVQITLHDHEGRRRIGWEEVGELDWSHFAIVLGAGGATGLSFEAGCLLALATDHRVRVRDAAALVGTSAGSVAGSLIATGFDAVDLAAVVAEVHQHLGPRLASMNVRFDGEMPKVPGLVHLLRRPSIGSAVTGVGLVMRRRFTAALANALKQGQFDLSPQLRFLDDVEWPADGRLRVCATQVTTGRRRVFSDASGVPLMDAVAASFAVPGVMRPVMIEGTAYLDGGLVSPTNADVLDNFDGGLILVISPMSGRYSTSAIGRMSGAHARRRLISELGLLRRRRAVLVIEPANALSAMIVDDALATDHAGEILTTAFLSASQD